MKYVRVIQWSAEDDGIQLEMLGDDDQTHSFKVGAECAGALAAGLAAQLEKVNANGGEQQFIRPKGMQTGKTAQDEPMLFMTLEGGTELPLVFRPEALPQISDGVRDTVRSLGNRRGARSGAERR